MRKLKDFYKGYIDFILAFIIFMFMFLSTVGAPILILYLHFEGISIIITILSSLFYIFVLIPLVAFLLQTFFY